MKQLQALEFIGTTHGVEHDRKIKVDYKLKTREQHLKEMQRPHNEYDLLIIGGGSKGAGVAVDAASRGLKCAVIDQYDFAGGASSRSSKLARGGFDYFERLISLRGDPILNY